MSQENAGCALGAGAIVMRLVAWVGLGMLTFSWIEVNDFGSAILWLIVWHLATTVVHFLLIGFVLLFANK